MIDEAIRRSLLLWRRGILKNFQSRLTGIEENYFILPGAGLPAVSVVD